MAEIYKGVAIATVSFPVGFAPQGDMFTRTYKTLGAAKGAITKYLNSEKNKQPVAAPKRVVYRIETVENARGMYRGGGGGMGLYSCPAYNQSERHPAPEDDTKLRNTLLANGLLGRWDYGNYVFGFGSIDQLRGWLYDDAILAWLHDKGFILAICEVDKALLGNTQCMFVKPETYEKKSIKEFFKLS
jgi:hypothetical protein